MRMWRKRAGRAVLGFASGLLTIAVAFFFAGAIGDGTHEGTTGTGSEEELNVAVSFPDGLTPTDPVQLDAQLQNTTSETLSFETMDATIETPTVPVCGEKWLELKAQGYRSSPLNKLLSGGAHESETTPLGPYPPGTTALWGDGLGGSAETTETTVALQFKGQVEGTPASEINQSSCEAVPVIVSIHLDDSTF